MEVVEVVEIADVARARRSVHGYRRRSVLEGVRCGMGGGVEGGGWRGGGVTVGAIAHRMRADERDGGGVERWRVAWDSRSGAGERMSYLRFARHTLGIHFFRTLGGKQYILSLSPPGFGP